MGFCEEHFNVFILDFGNGFKLCVHCVDEIIDKYGNEYHALQHIASTVKDLYEEKEKELVVACETGHGLFHRMNMELIDNIEDLEHIVRQKDVDVLFKDKLGRSKLLRMSIIAK